MAHIKATELGAIFALADGTIILRHSVTQRAVYIKGVLNGRAVRREYDLDEMVEVEDEEELPRWFDAAIDADARRRGLK